MDLIKLPTSNRVDKPRDSFKRFLVDADSSKAIILLLDLRAYARTNGLRKLKALVEPLILEMSKTKYQDYKTAGKLNSHKTKKRISLSKREIQCLKCCADGKTYWETGKILGISERTVVFHTKSAKEKMDCVSLTQCVAKAVRAGVF